MKRFILFAKNNASFTKHAAVSTVADNDIYRLYKEGKENKDLTKLRLALQLQEESNQKSLFFKPNFIGQIVSAIKEINKEHHNRTHEKPGL